MDFYNSGTAKMIDFIYEDFIATGNFMDSEEYSFLINEVDILIKDKKINEIANKCAFAASRQFFILGFLKAAELFNIEFGYAKE